MLSPNGLCRPFYRGRLDRLREHCHPCTICEPRRGPASCVSIPWVAHTQSSVRMKVELTVRGGESSNGPSRSAAGNPAIDFYERERGSSVLHCLADAGPAPRGVCGARDGHPRPHVARMCTKWREIFCSRLCPLTLVRRQDKIRREPHWTIALVPSVAPPPLILPPESLNPP